ncbi:hypothetical protein GR11A_00167 [Vibrio phage vB_VcorM_GR11A]|nr:hypothetical protein GR11A_00167 [Vibrio phage vB_VcorM_GR11A]
MATDFCFRNIPEGFVPDYMLNESGCLTCIHGEGKGSFSYTPIRRWIRNAVDSFHTLTGNHLWYGVDQEGNRVLRQFSDYISGLGYMSDTHRVGWMGVVEHQTYIDETRRLIKDLADGGAEIDWIEE